MQHMQARKTEIRLEKRLEQYLRRTISCIHINLKTGTVPCRPSRTRLTICQFSSDSSSTFSNMLLSLPLEDKLADLYYLSGGDAQFLIPFRLEGIPHSPKRQAVVALFNVILVKETLIVFTTCDRSRASALVLVTREASRLCMSLWMTSGQSCSRYF